MRNRATCICFKSYILLFGKYIILFTYYFTAVFYFAQVLQIYKSTWSYYFFMLEKNYHGLQLKTLSFKCTWHFNFKSRMKLKSFVITEGRIRMINAYSFLESKIFFVFFIRSWMKLIFLWLAQLHIFVGVLSEINFRFPDMDT